MTGCLLALSSVPAAAAQTDTGPSTITGRSATHTARADDPTRLTDRQKTLPARTRPRSAPSRGATVSQATAVLNQCASQGELTRPYSRVVLRKALEIMSAATQQYSNCSDVIHEALAHHLAAVDTHRPNTDSDRGSGGSTTIIVAAVLVLLVAAVAGLGIRRQRTTKGAPDPQHSATGSKTSSDADPPA